MNIISYLSMAHIISITFRLREESVDTCYLVKRVNYNNKYENLMLSILRFLHYWLLHWLLHYTVWLGKVSLKKNILFMEFSIRGRGGLPLFHNFFFEKKHCFQRNIKRCSKASNSSRLKFNLGGGQVLLML